MLVGTGPGSKPTGQRYCDWFPICNSLERNLKKFPKAPLYSKPLEKITGNFYPRMGGTFSDFTGTTAQETGPQVCLYLGNQVKQGTHNSGASYLQSTASSLSPRSWFVLSHPGSELKSTLLEALETPKASPVSYSSPGHPELGSLPRGSHTDCRHHKTNHQTFLESKFAP